MYTYILCVHICMYTMYTSYTLYTIYTIYTLYTIYVTECESVSLIYQNSDRCLGKNTPFAQALAPQSSSRNCSQPLIWCSES